MTPDPVPDDAIRAAFEALNREAFDAGQRSVQFREGWLAARGSVTLPNEREKWSEDEWHTDSEGGVLGGAPADFVFVAKSTLEAAEAELENNRRLTREWIDGWRERCEAAEARVASLEAALTEIADPHNHPSADILKDRARAALDAAPSRNGRLEAQDCLIERVRDALRPLGYAVAVHGSRTRDLDLIAVPWVEDAEVDRHVIFDALRKAGFDELGMGRKASPHNRLGYAMHGLPGSAEVEYIDLSVVLPAALRGPDG